MSLARRAATIFDSVAVLRSLPGPPIPMYAVTLDSGALFRWSIGSVLVDDGVTVIGASGGTGGAWLRVREDDLGADITPLTTTLTVGGKRCRRIPMGTLVADLSLTLSMVNAVAGDEIEIPRFDVSAYTVPLVNGGPAAGTLTTLPAFVSSIARVYCNGTNWVLRSSGLML